MRSRWVALLSALLAIAASLTLAASAHTARAAAVAALAKPAVPTTGAYLGAYVDVTGGPDRESDVANIETATQRPLAIDNHYELWGQPLIGDDQIEDAAYGRIPMISWRCPSGAAKVGGDAAIIDGSFDNYIKGQAKAVAAYGHPVFIRWFWEMDLDLGGNQRCLGPQGSLGYIQAWQHIVHMFREYGATNASFVWNPSSSYAGSSAAQYYPGDGYVDWIAADGYAQVPVAPATELRSFASIFTNFYAQWAGRKPLMIGETGVATLPDPKAPATTVSDPGAYTAAQAVWVSDMLAALPTQFPDIHALVYYDTANPRSDYLLGSEALNEIKTLGSTTYFQHYGTAVPISFKVTTGTGKTMTNAALTVTATGFPTPALAVLPSTADPTTGVPTGCRFTPSLLGTASNVTGAGTFSCDEICPGTQSGVIQAVSTYGAEADTALYQDSVKRTVSLKLTGAPHQTHEPKIVTNNLEITPPQTVGVCADTTQDLTLSGLPAGVSFVDNHDGTGTVSFLRNDLVPGETNLTLTAHNRKHKHGPATATFTIPLSVDSTGHVTTTDAVAATVGQAFSYTLGTDGYPHNSVYVIGAMPKWMRFISYGNGTAMVFGVPPTENVYTVQFATKGFALPSLTPVDTKSPSTTYNLIVTVNP